MSTESSIDLVKYGVLWQKVEDYDKKFDSMEKKKTNLNVLLKNLYLWLISLGVGFG